MFQEEGGIHDFNRAYDGPLRFTNSMSEDEVREEIASLLSMKKTCINNFEGVSGDDFEFVKCANRRVRVPDGTISFDGETLRSMYKGGSVYVRLTRPFSTCKVSLYIWKQGHVFLLGTCQCWP